jgi:hypothetical protein
VNPVTKCALTSIGACTSSFILTVMPYLQFIAVVLSIIAGIRALWHSWKRSK